MLDIDISKVNDDTVFVLEDLLLGTTDKVVKGRLGLIHAANIILEEMIEDVKEMNCEGYNIKEPTLFTDDEISDDNIKQAIEVLEQDNYDVILYEDSPILCEYFLVGENIEVCKKNNHLVVVDLTEIKYDNNIYNIS